MAKKSDLLIDSDEVLILQTRLAIIVGDRQAIALQQIHYWAGINEKAQKQEHCIDDQWWAYNTWREWHDKNFPFWSVSTIRRVFSSLEEVGLIITRPHPEAQKGAWVTINYGRLEELLKAHDSKADLKVRRRTKHTPVQIEQGVQNEQPPLSKMSSTPVQNEQALRDTENTETTQKKEIPAPQKSAELALDPPHLTVLPKTKTDPMYDAIKAVWKYMAGLNGDMAKMLTGKAVKKGWKEYNITPAMTPDEVVEWAAWYRKAELGGDSKLNMLANHAGVQSSVYYWRELKTEQERAKAAAAQTSEEFEADDWGINQFVRKPRKESANADEPAA